MRYSRDTINGTRVIAMKKNIMIAPSILAADFSRLGDEVKRAEKAGADMIHVDVMDGHFVPNITIGPSVVRDIRKTTALPLDVHLMIDEPSKYVDAFGKAGSDIITVHAECGKKIGSLLSRIRDLGIKAGISVKPKSPLSLIRKYLKKADMALIMTVEPGFGGQPFIKDTLPKIKRLREIYGGDIQVDGGINGDTARQVIEAGANIMVAGTYVFKADDMKHAIRRLKGVTK